MKSIINKIILKFFSIKDRVQREEQLKLLKQNPKSEIHSSFKLGNNNYMDISDSAEIHFAENTQINESNYLTIKKNAQFIIGKNTYIGDNCILGEGMTLFDHNHQYTREPFSVSKTDFVTAPIKIGNNVWTGANCIILKGVTIGDNVILGAGCVVHKDIPANSIVINKQEQIIKNL